MEATHLRPLVTAAGPFVSVYFDDTRDSAETVAVLDAKWRDIRREAEALGADERALAALEQAVLHGPGAVGRQGRGLVATADGVLIDEHLATVPAEPVVRVSPYPYVLPLLDSQVWRPAYLFVAVDHVGADIAVHQDGAVRSETVEGDGYPVHKPTTAGWNGYGDMQRSAEEAVRMNVRAVADRVTELTHTAGAEVVFVCGEVRSRSQLEAALPERVAARVVPLHAGALGHRATEAEVRDLVAGEFERRRSARLGDIADRFRREQGRQSGLAVEGLAAVCAALRDGDVETLIVGRLADLTVVTGQRRTTVAPDADVLSELGQAPGEVVRADEALPFAALAVGASLAAADEGIEPEQGVAALLRYVLAEIG